jgi:serine/threonine protein kinase
MNYQNGRGIFPIETMNAFLPDYEGRRDVMINRALRNQTLIKTNLNEIRTLDTEESLKKYLFDHSQSYKNVLDITKLAQGGESIVYGVSHAGIDEVVIKCPLMKDLEPNFVFSAIMQESMTLKLVPLDSHICIIKEELIEYNETTGRIISYCVVVERATNSLSNILNVWSKPKERERMYEYYSEEKLASIFYNSVYGLAFLHSKNIFYSDMKTDNLLVFRDMQVKLGDFGITCKLQYQEKDFDSKIYHAKGCTPGFIPKELMHCFEDLDENPMSRNEMFSIDVFALK